MTTLTRPVEGSFLVITESIHSSSAVQKQLGNGFVTIPTCQEKWSLLVLVNSTHSSPVVQEHLGHKLVTTLTRPVEGSL